MRPAHPNDLEAVLRRAIEDRTLSVRYQPIVEMRTGAVVGGEALARWQCSERGTIPPSVFIPLAESTGLIVPLGRWMLGEACRAAAAWGRERSDGAASPAVSVNVSGRQLQHPGFLEDVAEALRVSALAPHRLLLEVTESVLLADLAAAIGRLEALRALGVRLALDDFGTGYSSLGYLDRLPVDVLKIDRTFVGDIAANARRAAIVRAVVSLASALGLRSVVEGVETAEQSAALLEAGCSFGQGFHYATPLTNAAFERFVQARRVFAPQVRRESYDVGSGAIPGTAAHAPGRPTEMLVEDDDAARRVIRRMLQRGGYDVLEATDGADALRKIVAAPDRVGLVLTDVVLPALSGRSLADSLGACAPQARVLFMSGYAADDIVGCGVPVPDGPVLAKPFTPERLLGAVRASFAM